MKVVSIFLITIFSIAHAQRANDTALLRNLSREKFTWMIAKDTAKLSELLDANIQYIHSNGWIETRAEVINDIVTGKLEYKSVTVETDTVRLYQKTAIITGRGMFKVALDGKEVALQLLYTEVYTKQKQHWKLVQRNACKL